MQQTIVTLIDDLDGEEAAETVHFGLDDKTFVIDLSEVNARRLREAIAPYTDVARTGAARPAGSNGSVKARYQVKTGKSEMEQIRKWLTEQGHTVAQRGRIPVELRKAYDEAH